MEIVKIVQNGIELDVNSGEINASSITQDANNRFVTDTEKTTWNNKQNKLTAGTNVTITGTTISAVDKDTITTINGKTGAITKADIVALGIPGQDTNTIYVPATTTTNGLMSSADKTKLNGVETGAQKNNVTSTDISNWNNKVDKVSGKQLSTNDFTNSYKSKLDGLENYDDSELRYQELSVVASNPNQDGIYGNVVYSRRDGTTYASSEVALGDNPKLTVIYYDETGVTPANTIKWNLTIDDSGFAYRKELV